MRQVILYPGEDGYWVVECPSLPGCVSQGKPKKKQWKTSVKPSKAMSSPSNKMVCLSHRSGSTRFCLQYDEVASDIGARVRYGAHQSGLSD